MALTLKLIVGSDQTLDRDKLTIVRKFQVRGTLPYTGGGDAFDYVSSSVMGLIVAGYPTYGTPMGTLYWNSIQLHENHYAQLYDISVTYSTIDKQTGTYQITVDQAVGTQKVTAGVRIAGYGPKIIDSKGVFFDGKEVTGIDVPVAEDKLSVSYRHPKAYLNHSYIRAVGRLRGYPNEDSFLGYAPGEVVYMGGQFTESEAEASASYSFAISPNVTNLVVGGITITEKKGWDAVSPVYVDKVDSTSGDEQASRELKCIEIIRPREWKAYRSAFGWG
jgi:hypothetical protein